MKKAKTKQAHTSMSKIGMGDYYGSGVKQPMGKIVRSYLSPSLGKGTSKPPKSLA